MDDIERAIDDAVNTYKSSLANNKFVPGAGATEAILASRLEEEAKTLEDLNQYSYNRYALSFEIIPRILAENGGLNINIVIPTLIAKVKEEAHGINVEVNL